MGLGAVLRAGPWLRPNAFFGVLEYDDGVYYGAARALLDGLVPYRDFTVVHPPLTWVLLLPAALTGRLVGDPIGMAAARVEVLLAECLNIVLVYLLARAAVPESAAGRRQAGGLIAAGLYAVAPGAVIAGHTVLLEPLSTLPALAGMWLLLCRPLTSRAAFGGGALLAAALSVKLFAGVYIVVATAWLLVIARRRLVAFGGGFAAANAAIVGPYLVAAGPSRVWRDVVTTQLMRPTGSGASGQRLRSIAGLGQLSVGAAVALAVVLGLAGLLVVVSVRRGPRQDTAAVWVWIGLAALTAVAFLQSPTYYEHYGAFLAAPAAVAVGSCVALAGFVVALAALALLGLAVTASARSVVSSAGQPSLASAAAVVPRSACVYSDSVSLLIAADRFTVPDRRCPGWIDGRGQNLMWSIDAPSDPHFYPHGFIVDQRWQQQTLAQLRAADFLLVRSDPTRMAEWGPPLRSYVAAHFRRVWAAPGRTSTVELWQRPPR
jgi:hypothetical protein